MSNISFSPDGTRIIAGNYEGRVMIWDAKAAIKIGEPLKGHSGPITSVSFSPDSKRLVSGSWD